MNLLIDESELSGKITVKSQIKKKLSQKKPASEMSCEMFDKPSVAFSIRLSIYNLNNDEVRGDLYSHHCTSYFLFT